MLYIERGQERVGKIMKSLLERIKQDKIRIETALITMGFYLIGRSAILGYGFVDVGTEFSPNGTYALLDSVMALSIWGYLLIANSLLYLIGSLIARYKHIYSPLIFAGVTGAILMFYYTSASWANSTTKIHTHGYMYTFSAHLAVVLIGGVAYWIKRSSAAQIERQDT